MNKTFDDNQSVKSSTPELLSQRAVLANRFKISNNHDWKTEVVANTEFKGAKEKAKENLRSELDSDDLARTAEFAERL